MGINFEKFVSWAKKRFDNDVVVKGSEVQLNSIFTEDSGHHMWCSPEGGVHKRKYGVYRCFKTDQKGSLIKLVSLVEHCDWNEAREILDAGKTSLRDLEAEVERFFKEQEKHEEDIKLVLPEKCFLISSLKKSSWWRKQCEDYMSKRKIPINSFYICTEKPYKCRIIIPYYNKMGDLIYWNGRHIFDKDPKYRGPDKSCGVGKGDVVYFPYGKYPSTGEEIHICEGEFNSISLYLSGLNSAACGGKNMGEKQALFFKDYSITLCLDNDKAGLLGSKKMNIMINSLISVGRTKLQYVLPPQIYNDWNKMYIHEGPEIVKAYIERFKKELDVNTPYGIPSWELLQ